MFRILTSFEKFESFDGKKELTLNALTVFIMRKIVVLNKHYKLFIMTIILSFNWGYYN